MIALIRLELRKLAPLFAILLFVEWGDLLFEPFHQRLDEHPWLTASDDGSATAWLLLIFGLVVAHSLFAREHDEGTIDFLYSLPVSRRQVFFAKVLAAFTVLVLAEVGGELSAWIVQLPNHQSFTGHQFRLGLAARRVLLAAAFSGIVLCYGVLCSFFRRFALLIYALAGVLLAACERAFPSAGRFDPRRLLDYEYRGARLIIPWKSLSLHVAAGALALAVACLLWTGAGERIRALLRRIAGGWIGAIGLVLTAILLMVLAVVTRSRTAESPAHYEDFSTVTAQTQHYTIVYPSNLRERALGVIRIADGAYVDVQRALDAHAGGMIAMDLTYRGSEYAGITSWQKILLDLAVGAASDRDSSQLARALYHETTHAFEYQESDRRIQDHGDQADFFAEGLAEMISRQQVPSAGGVAAHRLAAAAMARLQIRFEDLIDDRGFRARHYGPLIYPLGETWTEALVRACGEKAPGKVLRAMGRANAPQGMAALAFWQDTLRAAGCELERVNATWRASIAELQQREHRFLVALPRLSGGVARKDGAALVLRMTLDRPPLADARYVARVRQSAATPEAECRQVEGSLAKGGVVELRIPLAWISGSAFELQLGTRFAVDGLPYFEDWQPAHLPE